MFFQGEQHRTPVPEEIFTPPPRTIERPQGLEQELLAAIRRKISSTKTSRLVDSSKRKPGDIRPSILNLNRKFRYWFILISN